MTKFEFYAALGELGITGALNYTTDLKRVGHAIEQIRRTYTEDQIIEMAREYRRGNPVCAYWGEGLRSLGTDSPA